MSQSQQLNEEFVGSQILLLHLEYYYQVPIVKSSDLGVLVACMDTTGLEEDIVILSYSVES
jgi:hypothetical protein